MFGDPFNIILPSSLLGSVIVRVFAINPKLAGSNPAEAMDFYCSKNPQHAFL
jgi:hypothetical protein